MNGSSVRPLISIVVCTYNRAHAIGATLESLLAQRYRPVEILVVDDGSTDATAAVVGDFGEAVRYHRLERNVGIARARSLAGQLARGELIAFQDDDDLMPEDRLEVLWEALHREPRAAFAVGDLELIDEQGRRLGSRWLPASGDEATRLVDDGYRGVLWPTLPVVPHTTLFRRADGERIGWFDERFRFAAEDKDFYARLAVHAPVVYVPQVVSLVRRGHESLTRNAVRTELGALELYRKHMDLIAAGEAGDAALYGRLQERVCLALERIATATSEERLQGGEASGCACQWLPRLPWRLRLRYAWRIRVRHPLRRLARRRSAR